MNRYLLGVAFICGVAAVNYSLGQAPMEAHERFVCTFGSAQRTVSIFIRPTGAKLDAAACRVEYTKDGTTQTLWASESDRSFCTAKAIGLVTKLTEGHFTCKPTALVKPEDTETAE